MRARRFRIALAVAALLALFAGRLLDTALQSSFTIDEAHYAAKGLYLWESGDYHWFDTLLFQPPLALHLASLPLVFVAERIGLGDFEPGRRAGYDLITQAETPLTGLRLASRLPFIAITCWGALIAFLWAREAAGDRAGLLAAFLFSFSPTVAAYGPLSHSDMALSVAFLQTLYAFWRWWRRPSPLRGVLCGLSLGVALAFKTSAVLLPAALAGIAAWLVWRRVGDSPALPLSRALLALAGIGVCALPVLWLAYGGSLRPHPMTIGPFQELPVPDYLHIFVFTGELAQVRRLFWLFGEHQLHTPWYALPVGFLLKTPLPILGLAAAAALRREPAFSGARLGPFLGIPALLYGLVACFAMKVPLGIRYLLPLHPLLFVFAATRLAGVSSRAGRLLLAGACTWLALLSFAVHPHYLSYFNELIGGRANAHRWFADSNVDWGQDVGTLARWLEQRGNPPVHTALFAVQRPEAFGIDARPLEGCRPVESGLVAISVAVFRGIHAAHDPLQRPPDGCYDWLRGREPVAIPGYSILVFDLGGRG